LPSIVGRLICVEVSDVTLTVFCFTLCLFNARDLAIQFADQTGNAGEGQQPSLVVKVFRDMLFKDKPSAQ